MSTSKWVGIAIMALLIVQPAPMIDAADRIARPDDVALATEVDALLARWNKPDAPGCAVAIVRDGERIYGKGFGSANLDHEVPNTLRTVYETGSFTKSFTCACIALLLDQGKITTEDDIRKYVPEMQAHDPPIRIRHLIRCRSGLWAQWHIAQLAGWYSEPIESPYGPTDLLALLSGQKSLPFEPGTQFRYGSSDYFLLGLIVERVSGKSLGEFARENLFEPLGMMQTQFVSDQTLVLKHRAVGYYRSSAGAWRGWSPHSTAVGGWGLQCSVDDLCRWARNFDDNRLPKGKFLDELLRDGTLLGNRNVLDADPIGKYRGLRRIEFTGGMPGFLAALVRFPDQRFTVVCLTNNWEINPWRTAGRIADLFLADRMEPALQAKGQDRVDPEVYVDVSEAELRDKVGAYRMNRQGSIWTVTFGDGHLRWTNHLDDTYRLRASSSTRFHPVGYPSPGNSLVFRHSTPEAPYSLTLEWPEGSSTLEPIELVDPKTLSIGDYVGEYSSDELATTYRFVERNGALWLRVNGRRWERLDPTVRDQFIPHQRRDYDNRSITFRRAEDGRVVGHSVSLWRVKGVDFEKR